MCDSCLHEISTSGVGSNPGQNIGWGSKLNQIKDETSS